MNYEKATLKIKIYRKTGSSQLRRRSNKDTLNKKVMERGVEEDKKIQKYSFSMNWGRKYKTPLLVASYSEFHRNIILTQLTSRHVSKFDLRVFHIDLSYCTSVTSVSVLFLWVVLVMVSVTTSGTCAIKGTHYIER